MLADCLPAHKAKATQPKLRGLLEPVSGESCLGKDVAFNIVGQDFRVSFRLLGLAVVVQVIRSKALKCHMRPPSIVPALEFSAQERQVVKSLDERDVFQPLVLERLDDPLSHSNGAALRYTDRQKRSGISRKRVVRPFCFCSCPGCR